MDTVKLFRIRWVGWPGLSLNRRTPERGHLFFFSIPGGKLMVHFALAQPLVRTTSMQEILPKFAA